MIKRRFFKLEHGDNSEGESSTSESSSDSENEIEAEEEEDRFDDNDDEMGVIGVENEPRGSGYESEDSSVNEVEEDEDPSGWSIDEDGEISEPVREKSKNKKLETGVAELRKDDKANIQDVAVDMDDPIQADISNYVLKQKTVFKCKLCPRIVCLSEDSLRTHLKSKRHVRSKKLLGEGRLKLMLNSDGEIEEDQETHAERHARTVALSQEVQTAKKKDSGRQRQNRRRKKRKQRQDDKRKTEQPKEKTMKKKRKTEK